MREQQILLEPKTLPNSYFGDSKRLNHQSRTANDDPASNGAEETGSIFCFESFKSRMADVEMVNIKTSPAPHPDHPQLHPDLLLHLVLGLGGQEIILGGLGDIQRDAD